MVYREIRLQIFRVELSRKTCCSRSLLRMTKYVRKGIRRRWTNAEKDRIVAEYRTAKSAHISHPLTNIDRRYSLDPPQLRKWVKNSARYSAFPHLSTVPTVVREGIFPEMEKALNEQVFRVLICSSCTSLVASLGMLRFWPSDIAVLLFHVIALVVWLCQC